MKTRRRWWWIFAGGAALVAVTLLWCTIAVLQLERDEYEARTQARYHEVVRLALWRMDSMLAPRLARESARPHFQYQSYYPQELAYTRMLTQIEEGAVLNASPLLTYQSDLVLLHFQIINEQLSSPEVPEGNWRDLAESSVVSGEQIDRAAQHLDRLRGLVQAQTVPAIIEQCAMQLTVASPGEVLSNDVVRSAETADRPSGQRQAYSLKTEQQWSQAEMAKRSQLNAIQSDVPAQRMSAPQQSAPMPNGGEVIENDKLGAPGLPPLAAVPSVTIDPFVPIWLPGGDDSADPVLIYVRRVAMTDGTMLQGFLVDWLALSSALLFEINDLIVDPSLEPVISAEDLVNVGPDGEATSTAGQLPFQLATVPATLTGSPVPVGALALVTPTRMALGIAWLVVVLAMFGTAVALNSSLAYGEKRSNFAWAVTHELRTPLTTFQLYSELLADDSVQDPTQRREYLEALRTESCRLARLVENVLTYARIEDGRAVMTTTSMAVEELLDHCTPHLDRLVRDAEMTLGVDGTLLDEDPNVRVVCDRDAVLRILTNLVENACKYGRSAERPEIVLETSINERFVTLAVRDHGPGVDADVRKALFTAFERGSGARQRAIPGVGLGLALGRALALGMHGRLDVENPSPSGFGASFILELPRADKV